MITSGAETITISSGEGRVMISFVGMEVAIAFGEGMALMCLSCSLARDAIALWIIRMGWIVLDWIARHSLEICPLFSEVGRP